jgi:hypothetical protein
MESLGPDFFGPPWGARTRWFRMTRREAQLTPPSRVTEDGTAWLDRPPSVEAALMYFSDLPDLLMAEQAALDFARALWAADGREGSPPEQVVWRVSGAGSVPSSYNHLDAPAVSELLALVQRRAMLPPPEVGFTGAFAPIARLVDGQGLWPEEVDPVAPFLRVWRTGLGLWAVRDGYLSLFAPERADAPSRWTDLAAVTTRKRQITLNLELMKICSQHGELHDLEICLASGADPNCVPSAHWGFGAVLPLHLLARRGRPEMVRALLDAGADPGATGSSGYNALAQLLLERRGLDPRTLLQGGFPLQARDARGRTALHQVCRAGQAEAALALIELGADIDALDVDGVTPLQLALARGQGNLLARLARAGADPHHLAHDGRTAYHFLVQSPSYAQYQLDATLEQLVTYGVANRPDRYGWLPDPLCPEAHRGRLPPPAPREPAPARQPWSEVPEALALPALCEQKGGWEVLGDWLQEQGDPRGHLIAMALAEEQKRLPKGSLDRELTRQRDVLLAPFREAHPMGLLLEEQAALSFRRGLLWRMSLNTSFLAGLPHLLQPASRLLCGLTLQVFDHAKLASLLPPRMLLRELTLVAQRPAELALPSEALPVLERLTVRGPLGTTLRARHPHLHELVLESPGEPVPWQVPAAELEVPQLRRLRIVACREPRAEDPGWGWLQQLLFRPPPELESLSVLPASIELLEWLVDAPILRQLRALSLLYSTPAILGPLESLAPRLASLQHLEISVVSLPRAERLLTAQRLSPVLPKLALSGTSPRGRGAYS